MIQIKGVCYFTIAVTDSRRSTDFYTNVLGLKLLSANYERDTVILDSAGNCVVLMKTVSRQAGYQCQGRPEIRLS